MALNRGVAFHSLFRYEEALCAFEDAEKVFQELGDKGTLATIARYRGQVFQSLSRYEEALCAFEDAEKVFRKLGDERTLAGIGIDRGAVFCALSRYQEALNAFEAAARVFRKSGDERRLASIALNRGSVFFYLSRYEESLIALKEAAKVFRKLGDEESLANIAQNRGAVFQFLFRHEDAIRAYEDAAKFYRKLGDEKGVARIALNRGAVFQSLFRYEEALSILEDAAKVFRKLGVVEELANIATNRGTIFLKLSRYKEALSAYGDASKMYRRLGNKGKSAMIAEYCGIVFCSLGQHRESLYAYNESLDLVEHLLAEQVQNIGEESSRGFRRGFESLPHNCAQVTLAIGNKSAKENAGELRLFGSGLSFRAIEVIQGRSLQEGLVRGNEDLSSARLDESQRRELAEVRLARRQKLGEREKLSSEKGKSEELANVVEALKALDHRERRIAESVRLLNPLAAQAVYPKAIKLAELQANLSENTALIELALDDELAWGIVVTPTRLELVKLGDPKEILADLKKIKVGLAGGSQILDLVIIGRLSKALLGPVIEVLGWDDAIQPNSLVFSLKGELARIPVEILLTEDVKPETAMKDLPYLVKSFDVTYVPSATTFVAMKKQAVIDTKKERRAGLEFFALGMPLDVIAEAKEEGREDVDLVTSDLDPFLTRGASTRSVLFGSKSEVLGIAALFANDKEKENIETVDERIEDEELSDSAKISGVKGKRFKVLLRGGAHEKNFKNDSGLEWARFVHFAGHAEADLTSPSLSRLVLAQSKRLSETTGEDGFLYFRELTHLELHADMLVLSACSTNDGVLFPTEGIMGLAQGGLLAGAKSVLSTLWRVEDESAQRLMVEFYKRVLNGKSSRIHALAEAKREAIRQGLPLSTWSAYILWDADIGQ